MLKSNILVILAIFFNVIEQVYLQNRPHSIFDGIPLSPSSNYLNPLTIKTDSRDMSKSVKSPGYTSNYEETVESKYCFVIFYN